MRRHLALASAPMHPYFLALIASTLGFGCGGSSSTPASDMSMLLDQGGLDLGGDLAAARACLPAGSVVVPFVTTDPVRSFAMAEPTLVTGKDYIAAIDTDVGCMVIDLNETVTPITTNSFIFLSLHHFFDGIAFHRVIDGFVAQAGDPNSVSGEPASWGTGDAGYQFGLEVSSTLNYDGAGVVGMARSNDPNTNSSQFFITLAAAPSLNQMYTIFGKVTVGLDILPKIVRGEPPTMPTRIRSVTIATK